jgi:hypothetical protein
VQIAEIGPLIVMVSPDVGVDPSIAAVQLSQLPA